MTTITMAAVESLWLAVKVISGSKVLFGSKIVQCQGEQSFGQLLSQIEGEHFAEKQVRLKVEASSMKFS